MTPHFEPCGYQNLNYPMEGVLVVGHAVDGIADSVRELNASHNTGTGFPYIGNTKEGLFAATERMTHFANQAPHVRYPQLERIARESVIAYTSTNKEALQNIAIQVGETNRQLN